MNTTDIRPDDREALSALFDGELDGEARMFAMRRLGHDAAWQRACGEWQLIGDVMRRQAPIAAPADLAGRVSAAVALEPSPVAIAPVVGARPPAASRAKSRRNRWIGGGALAASLALAVAMTSLPSGQTDDARAAPVVASRDAVPATVAETTSAPPAVAASTRQADRSNATRTPALRAPAVAAMPVERRVASAASRPDTSNARRPAAQRPVSEAPTIAATALLADPPVDPFNLGRNAALTARPWPRAASPAGSGTFTARYGTSGASAGERPTFYPFEPRPQADAQLLAPPSP